MWHRYGNSRAIYHHSLRSVLTFCLLQQTEGALQSQCCGAQIARSGGDVRVSEKVAHVVELCTGFQEPARELSTQVVEVQILYGGFPARGAPCRFHRRDATSDFVTEDKRVWSKWLAGRIGAQHFDNCAQPLPHGNYARRARFRLCARRTNVRNRPLLSISTSRHCSFRSSPTRQPVESAAMISARKCGVAAFKEFLLFPWL